MTIGELFVKLGFKIDGAEDFKKVAQDLKDSAATAGKLALGVDAITAGFTGMMGWAMTAGNALGKFALTTGLSTTELQQWQFAAAKAGVSSQELEETVKRLQMVAPKVLMGGGEGMAAWTLLGLNPTDNPFVMLAKMNGALQSFDNKRVAAARYLAGQIGISDNFFQFLRRTLDLNLGRNFVTSPEEIEKLSRMYGQWKAIGFEMAQIKNKGGVIFQPWLETVVGDLAGVNDKLANWINGLNSGGLAAEANKTSINNLALEFTGLAIALTAVAGASKGARVLLVALEAVATPLGAALLAIAAFAGIELLNDKPETGGKSIEFDKGKKFPKATGPDPADSQIYGASMRDYIRINKEWMKQPGSPFGEGRGPTITLNAPITINGVDANNISAVGRATYDSVTRALMNTQYQQPAQSR